jgi:hypothetical protein
MKRELKVVPYTTDKIWSACLIFLFFLAVCLNISTVINIKILTNSNQQTQSYKFTSHIAAFLSVFDHRDAWNLHTNIIWSKRSTDLKELSPCSVWYHLKQWWSTIPPIPIKWTTTSHLKSLNIKKTMTVVCLCLDNVLILL